MSIQIDPHQVVVREHRNGTHSITGLNGNDLNALLSILTAERLRLDGTSDDNERAWCKEFVDALSEHLQTEGFTGATPFELPWVER